MQAIDIYNERVRALTLDLFEQVGYVFVVKGQGPAEEGVEDDAARPHVDLGALGGERLYV